MDIAAEPGFVPEFSGGIDQFLHHNVGVRENPRRKEKPFDVIPAVKLAGNIHEFIHREGSPLGVRRSPVDAIGAVKTAGIGKKHF
jgi:hypothetical protein